MIDGVFKKNLYGSEVSFHKTGVVFIKKSKTLLVADLHLGKGASLNFDGNLVPTYDIKETIDKLMYALARFHPSKIIALGDSFHDKNSIINLDNESLNLIRNITDNYEVFWIYGNHDKNIKCKNKIGGNFFHTYSEDNFSFIHEKKNKPNKHFEFSGHFHPKTILKINNSKFSYKCFVLGKKFCILPSFGLFTGGIDIKSRVFKNIISEKVELVILGKNKIVTSTQIL